MFMADLGGETLGCFRRPHWLRLATGRLMYLAGRTPAEERIIGLSPDFIKAAGETGGLHLGIGIFGQASVP